MPFYEYQCKNCGHELEAMQKISDAPLKKCPHCGKSQLQRLISAPVFRLKGGGWYETDFKDDKDKKRNLADSAEPAEAAKADAKPAEAKADTPAKAADSDTKPKEKEGSKPVAAKATKSSKPTTSVKSRKPAKKKASKR